MLRRALGQTTLCPFEDHSAATRSQVARDQVRRIADNALSALPAAFDTRYFSILIVRGDDHSTAVLAGIGHVTQLRIDRNGQWRRWRH
jgi:uncharacterized protein YgbK (DUF1537 family)